MEVCSARHEYGDDSLIICHEFACRSTVPGRRKGTIANLDAHARHAVLLIPYR